MSSPEAAAPEAPEEQAPAVDEVRQGMLDTLTAELGDAIVGSQIEKGDLWVRVRPPKDQSNFEGWVAARFGYSVAVSGNSLAK